MKELDLNIGAQVFCSGDRCGKLAKAAVNSETMQVTHLIVEEGFLLKRSRVFPISSVDRTTPDEITLSITVDELEKYPEYREEVVERPVRRHEDTLTPAAWREGMPHGQTVTTPVQTVRERVRYGVPEELAVIGRGTPINGLEGQIGKLDHLLVEAGGGEISRLVVQQGLLFTTQKALPVSIVESIAESGISVAARTEELRSLPQYEVDGYEGTGRDNSSHSAPNDPDAELVTRVAMALFDDPRTSKEVIEVIDEHGVITLQGGRGRSPSARCRRRYRRAASGRYLGHQPSADKPIELANESAHHSQNEAGQGCPASFFAYVYTSSRPTYRQDNE